MCLSISPPAGEEEKHKSTHLFFSASLLDLLWIGIMNVYTDFFHKCHAFISIPVFKQAESSHI